MVGKYPISQNDYENINVDDWANESYELSKSNVYSGITEKQALPDDYVTKNQDAIQRQIVLGGLRLATVMKTIFGSSILAELVDPIQETFL